MANRIDNLRGSIDPINTKFALGYHTTGFIGQYLFPDLFVDEPTGQIPTFGKDHLKIYDTRRAAGADPKRAGMSDITWASYELYEEALERVYDITEEAAANFNLARHTTKATLDPINLAKEADIAAMAQTAANYTNSTSLTSTAIWDSGNAAAVPRTNIDTGSETIRAAIGVKPNVMVMGETTFNVLKKHSDYTGVIAYSGNTLVNEDLIGQVHSTRENKMQVYISGIQYDNAGTLTDLWLDNLILAYVPSNSKNASMYEPSFARMLRLKGYPEIRTYNAHNSGITKAILAREFYFLR